MLSEEKPEITVTFTTHDYEIYAALMKFAYELGLKAEQAKEPMTKKIKDGKVRYSRPRAK